MGKAKWAEKVFAEAEWGSKTNLGVVRSCYNFHAAKPVLELELLGHVH